MAGFACIVGRHGQPVDPATLERLAESLRHRGPDGVTTHLDGAIGLAHAALHSTPESVLERQPFHHPGGWSYVGDVRIDNRAELINALGWARPATETTDIELIAAAHQRWGRMLGERIVGDFAFAAVTPSGEVEAYRDHMGVRPVHYWCSSEWFVVASELRQIAAVPEGPSAIDVGIAGEYLSGHVESDSETVIENVHRLPAAHLLRLGQTLTTARYWTPSFADPILLPSRDDYRERFRELFDEAVRCRLRSVGLVGCQLSGGLDSTSVASAAATAGVDLRAFSCTYRDAPRSDEMPFIRTAVEHLGLRWEAVTTEPAEPRWAFDDVTFWSDIPLPPDSPARVEIGNRIRSSGGRVILTGHGGDHWMDASSYILVELCATGDAGTAWRTARSWASGDPRLAAALIGQALSQAYKPSWVRRPGIRRAPWVSGAARERARLDERRHLGELPRVEGGHRANAVHHINGSGYEAMSRLILDRTGSRAGVETRHPYLDRRLMEFACRIPASVHHEPGRNRTLQRDALADLLPEANATRRSKASFSEVWWNEIRRHTSLDELAASHLTEMGWLDVGQVRAAWRETDEKMRASAGAGRALALWGMIQIEALLRHLDCRDHAAA